MDGTCNITFHASQDLLGLIVHRVLVELMRDANAVYDPDSVASRK